MTITKDVDCPLCKELVEVVADPADDEQELECPWCGETLGVDCTDGEVTLSKLDPPDDDLEDEEDETAEGAIVDPPDDEPDAE